MTKYAVTPDGRYVVFTGWFEGETHDDRHLYVVPTDSSSAPMRVARAHRNTLITVSPNSQFAAFVTPGLTLTLLNLRDMDTQPIRRLIALDLNRSVTFSPDSRLVAWQTEHVTHLTATDMVSGTQSLGNDSFIKNFLPDASGVIFFRGNECFFRSFVQPMPDLLLPDIPRTATIYLRENNRLIHTVNNRLLSTSLGPDSSRIEIASEIGRVRILGQVSDSIRVVYSVESPGRKEVKVAMADGSLPPRTLGVFPSNATLVSIRNDEALLIRVRQVRTYRYSVLDLMNSDGEPVLVFEADSAQYALSPNREYLVHTRNSFVQPNAIDVVSLTSPHRHQSLRLSQPFQTLKFAVDAPWIYLLVNGVIHCAPLVSIAGIRPISDESNPSSTDFTIAANTIVYASDYDGHRDELFSIRGGVTSRLNVRPHRTAGRVVSAVVSADESKVAYWQQAPRIDNLRGPEQELYVVDANLQESPVRTGIRVALNDRDDWPTPIYFTPASKFVYVNSPYQVYRLDGIPLRHGFSTVGRAFINHDQFSVRSDAAMGSFVLESLEDYTDTRFGTRTGAGPWKIVKDETWVLHVDDGRLKSVPIGGQESRQLSFDYHVVTDMALLAPRDMVVYTCQAGLFKVPLDGSKRPKKCGFHVPQQFIDAAGGAVAYRIGHNYFVQRPLVATVPLPIHEDYHFRDPGYPGCRRDRILLDLWLTADGQRVEYVIEFSGEVYGHDGDIVCGVVYNESRSIDVAPPFMRFIYQRDERIPSSEMREIVIPGIEWGPFIYTRALPNFPGVRLNEGTSGRSTVVGSSSRNIIFPTSGGMHQIPIYGGTVIRHIGYTFRQPLMAGKTLFLITDGKLNAERPTLHLPEILTHPPDILGQQYIAATTLSFDVTPEPSLSMRWEHAPLGASIAEFAELSDGEMLEGATTHSLTIRNIHAQPGLYRCKVSNADGFAYTRAALVNPEPVHGSALLSGQAAPQDNSDAARNQNVEAAAGDGRDPIPRTAGVVTPDEGEGEGEGEAVPHPDTNAAAGHAFHAADADRDLQISLSELLYFVQLFNARAYHCEPIAESGYKPGIGDQSCDVHSADYAAPLFSFSLAELLRVIALYNAGEYFACPVSASEDGYCPLP